MQVVIAPLLFCEFLVTIPTIPATIIKIATNAPKLPLNSPLPDIALLRPAAQDCNMISKNKIIDIIPITSFPISHFPFCITIFVSVLIISFVTGHPQFGQLVALSDTSFPHSLQLISAIFPSLFIIFYLKICYR